MAQAESTLTPFKLLLKARRIAIAAHAGDPAASRAAVQVYIDEYYAAQPTAAWPPAERRVAAVQDLAAYRELHPKFNAPAPSVIAQAYAARRARKGGSHGR